MLRLFSLQAVALAADGRDLRDDAGDGRGDGASRVPTPLGQGFQRLLGVARRQVVDAVHRRQLNLPRHACMGVTKSVSYYLFTELLASS